MNLKKKNLNKIEETFEEHCQDCSKYFSTQLQNGELFNYCGIGVIDYLGCKTQPIFNESNGYGTKVLQEEDPNGVQPKEPGSKLDANKPKVVKGVLQYFPRAIKEVAKVSEFGATKYTWKGWETVPNGIERYTDALGRHLLAEEIEGPITEDSGLLHASHICWNALARLELMLRENENLNNAMKGTVREHAI